MVDSRRTRELAEEGDAGGSGQVSSEPWDRCVPARKSRGDAPRVSPQPIHHNRKEDIKLKKPSSTATEQKMRSEALSSAGVPTSCDGPVVEEKFRSHSAQE